MTDFNGLVVFPQFSQKDKIYREEFVDEFKMLLKNLSIVTKQVLEYEIKKIYPATYISGYRVQFIKKEILKNNISVIAFLIDLSSTQRFNLIKEFSDTDVTILDRQEVILEIFRLNATTKYAKLQVELAQLQYILPQLKGLSEFSRLGGRVGTRGPGEQQLEYDRRNILKRITTVKRKLKKLDTNYKVQSKKRKNIFKVAICGYANSGKTSLLNRLTRYDGKTMRRPFTTLDTRIKRSYVDRETILVIDTIGFIRNLPKNLFIAFKTTMNVLNDVDLLLILYDLAAKDIGIQIEAVENQLSNILKSPKNKVIVFNKIDKKIAVMRIESFKKRFSDAFFISAKNNEGIEKLKKSLKFSKEKVKY
jgi:GTP-binding protein HflX